MSFGGYSDREQAQLDRYIEEDNGRSLDDARRKERVIQQEYPCCRRGHRHDDRGCLETACRCRQPYGLRRTRLVQDGDV